MCDLRDGRVVGKVTGLESYNDAYDAGWKLASGISTKYSEAFPVDRYVDGRRLTHGWQVEHVSHYQSALYRSDDAPEAQGYIQRQSAIRAHREHPDYRYEVRLTGRLYFEGEDANQAVNTFVRPWEGDGLIAAEAASWLCEIDMSDFVEMGEFSARPGRRLIKVWDCSTRRILEAYNSVPSDVVREVATILMAKYRLHFPSYGALACVPVNPTEESYYSYTVGNGTDEAFADLEKCSHIIIETDKPTDEKFMNLKVLESTLFPLSLKLGPLPLPSGTISFPSRIFAE